MYILKEDGREYFIDEFPVILFDNLLSPKKHGNIFTIKLNNTINNKEYLISISPNNTFELYDIEKKHVYEKSMKDLFGSNDFYQFTSAFIELGNYSYCLAMMASFESNSYLYLYKLSFQSIDITEVSPIISYEKYSSSQARMVSCYKTKLNYIICFYQTRTYNYKAIAFNNNLEFITTGIITSEKKEESMFFKCVHYFEETGAFAYFNSEGLLTLQFKLFTSSYTFENFYNKRDSLSISIGEMYYSVEYNDIIKLENKKICFVTTYIKMFYLIIIKDYHNGEIKIRKYALNLYNLNLHEFNNKINLSLYNDFIAIAAAHYYIKSLLDIEDSSSLVILSYANSKDFEIDITYYLKSYQDIIIDLNSNCNIDNNIFGLVPNGVKIINYEEEFELLSSKDNRKLNIGESINNDENITLILSKNITIPKNRKIIYAMIATEPDYDTYQKYVNTNVCACEEEDQEKNGYFIKNNYIGRHSYCNIKINENDLTNQCLNKNCSLCLKGNSSICVLNLNEQIKIEDGTIASLDSKIETILPETTYIETKLLETTYIKTSFPETTFIGTTFLEYIFSKETLPETTIPKITYIEATYIQTSLIDSINIEISTSKTNNNQIIPSQTIDIEKIIGSTFIETIPKKHFINDYTNIIETTTPDLSNIISQNKIDFNSSITYLTDYIYIDLKSAETSRIISDSSYELLKLNCSYDEIINNKCTIRGININHINEIKRQLLLKYNTSNIIIKAVNANIQLSTYKEQKNEIHGISNIDLGACEDILKDAYNISRTESLIIFKLDIKTEDLSSTYVKYELYSPKKEFILNLEHCKDVKITINIPIKLNKNIDLIYGDLAKLGYNLFNENDPFYQDICSTYTTFNGTDMLLSDRRKDIYSISYDQPLCQKGCEFKNYDSNNKKAKCDCKAETKELKNINIMDFFDKKEISQSFYSALKNSNFKVLKCYHLAFSSGITKNIGAIFMNLILVIFSILGIVSIIISQNKVHNILSKIISNNIPKFSKEIHKEKKTLREKKIKNSIKRKIKTKNKKEIKNAPVKKSQKIKKDLNNQKNIVKNLCLISKSSKDKLKFKEIKIINNKINDKN